MLDIHTDMVLLVVVVRVGQTSVDDTLRLASPID